MSVAEQLVALRMHAHIEDVRWLREWAREHPQANVVQLGAGSGTMACALLEGGPSLRLWSIDNTPIEIETHNASLQRAGASPIFAATMLEDSVDAANIFATSPLDLLIIDTTHIYEGTKAELEAWLPILERENALLYLHDYEPVEAAPIYYPGVKQAADELLGEWEIVARFGWSAVFGRKSE